MARSIFGRILTKAANAADPQSPAAARRRFTGLGRVQMSWGVPYGGEWDNERAIKDGLERSMWAYKATTTIANSVAGLPIDIVKGTPRVHDLVDPRTAPLLWNRLNVRSSDHEDAWTFRHRAVMQLLMSKRGIFIEYGQRSDGEIEFLQLLNADLVKPIPHPEKFVDGFELMVNGTPERIPGNVLWIKMPHPTDPYASLTPLSAAGLSIDIDYYSRLYNRNFMANDGRPAGLLTIGGGLSDDDAEVIKGRFSGNAEPGRVTVIEAEDASFEDLSTHPRDAAYGEARQSARDDVLGAFGVPKSQTGDASGTTQDQSEVEEYIYWRNTVSVFTTIFERAFSRLTPEADRDDFWVKHNTEEIRALQRPVREEDQRTIEQFRDGLLTMNEAFIRLRREPIKGMPGFDTYFLSAGKVGLPTTPEDAEGIKELTTIPPGAAPGELGDDQAQRLPGSPGAPRIAALTDAVRGTPGSPSTEPPQRVPNIPRQALPASSGGAAASKERADARAADEASRVGQRRDLRRTAKTEIDEVETKAGDFKWNMTSFDIPAETIAPLFEAASVSTEDPDQAHITLTLTDGAPLNDVTMEIVEQWSQRTAPITITIGPDLSSFPKGEDGVPIIIPISSPELVEARKDLRDALANAGLNVTEYSEFRPHITLAYVDKEPGSFELNPATVIKHTIDEVSVYAKGGRERVVRFTLSREPNGGA